MPMLPASRFAFKEWAVVCEALRQGRQSLILRKGGIHEGRAGFRVEHDQFWLFPTNFHQSPDELHESHLDLWRQVSLRKPSEEKVCLRVFLTVEQVIEISDQSLLTHLRGLHAWSDSVIQARFHYKQPGLFALLVRCYELPHEIAVPNSPHFAGCRSWVDLPVEIPMADLRPVMDDDQHHRQLLAIRRELNDHGSFTLTKSVDPPVG